MKCRQKEAGKARRIRMYCGAAASKGNEVAIFCFENPSPPMLFYRECCRGHSTTTLTEIFHFLHGQFLYPERGQKQTFFDLLPPHLVHVVIEWPPTYKHIVHEV